MSNKNTKKYTVKNFCKQYSEANAEQTKEVLIKSVMNPHYVPYEMKITLCEKIIEASYYTKTNRNGIEIKKLHINSPIQYLLYCLEMVRQYTHIEVDFSNVVDEFNMLNKCRLLDEIINLIPEYELKEFNVVLDMVRNDILQNEYETQAFISNQVERFGELFGNIIKPAIEKLSNVIDNMDEKTVNSLADKLKVLDKLKGKIK